MAEGRVEVVSTRDSRRGSEATKGDVWHAHRFLGLACVSLLYPLGAEVGLPLPAPPGWGQGVWELREKSLEARATTQLPSSLGAGPSAVTGSQCCHASWGRGTVGEALKGPALPGRWGG